MICLGRAEDVLCLEERGIENGLSLPPGMMALFVLAKY
jgi:hypothetical protein